jgi:two-component system cell cycle sensor histidine kinase/response regulator CckA
MSPGHILNSSAPSHLSSASRETILVVEDDGDLRRSVCATLAKGGYAVMQTGGGAEAMRFAVADAKPRIIGLLLVDVMLPLVSGVELSRRMQVPCPGLKVLYMSGYPDSLFGKGDMPAKGAPFLGKPFTPKQLAEKVRAVLDA